MKFGTYNEYFEGWSIEEVFDYAADPLPDDASPAHSDGVNQWPTGRGDEDRRFREVLLRHHASCERVAHALLRALSVSLDLAPDTLTPHFDRSSSFVRLNRYAACPEPADADGNSRCYVNLDTNTNSDEYANVYPIADARATDVNVYTDTNATTT